MSIMSMLDKHYFREQQQVRLGSKEDLFAISNVDAEALPIKPGIGDGVRTFQELLEIRLREHQDSPRLKSFNRHNKDSVRTDENAAEMTRFQTPCNKKKIVFTDRFQSSTKDNNAQRTFLKKGEGLKRFAAYKVPLIAPKSISRRQTFVKFKVNGSQTQCPDISQEQSSYNDTDALSIISDDPKTESSYIANEVLASIPQTPRIALKSLQGNTKTSQPSIADKCFVRKIKSVEPPSKNVMISFRTTENNMKVNNPKEKHLTSISSNDPATILKKSNSLVTINETDASPEVSDENDSPESNPESPKPRYNLRGSRKPNAQKSEEVVTKARGRRCKKQPVAVIEKAARDAPLNDYENDLTLVQKNNQSYSNTQVNEDHINDLLDRIERKKSTLQTNAQKAINVISDEEIVITACSKASKTKSKKILRKKPDSELINGHLGSKLESKYDNADDCASSSSGDWDRDSSVDTKSETRLDRGLASPKLGNSYIAIGRQIDRIQKSVDELQRLPLKCVCGRLVESKVDLPKDAKTASNKGSNKSSKKDSEVLKVLQRQIDELRMQIAQTKVG